MASGGTTSKPRGAVVGLGMMGRHHARLLQSSQAVTFAGAVDPGGDRYRAVHDSSMLFESVEALVAAGRLDFAIVSVPTEGHVRVVGELAGAGASVLVEKPLAATADDAREIVRLCEAAGVIGAVGHVERFNPALQGLRRRLLSGQVGRLFSVCTERTGPSPAGSGRRGRQRPCIARHRLGELAFGLAKSYGLGAGSAPDGSPP